MNRALAWLWLVAAPGALVGQGRFEALPEGGFDGARARELSWAEIGGAGPAAEWAAPLTVIVFDGTSWTEARAVRQVRRTAAILSQCGVGLGPVHLIRVRAPGGRKDVSMAGEAGPEGVPFEVERIAALLPESTSRPAAFLVGRLAGEVAPGRAFGGEGYAGPARETIWLGYRAHAMERRDAVYSTLAHELTHVLCECGHEASREPHLMNAHRNLLSARLRPEDCERVRAGAAKRSANGAR